MADMTRWFGGGNGQPQATTRLGPLEWRVLDALWQRGTPGTVRDLQPAFADIAYTTLMTTLDRLHRKHVLTRSKLVSAYGAELGEVEQWLPAEKYELDPLLRPSGGEQA